MRILVEDKEYAVKSRQAIEILTLVENSEVFKQFKNFESVLKNNKIEEAFTSLAILPQVYKLSADILAIATGTFVGGKIERNDALVDDIEALRVPMYALNIVKTLIMPIQYVITNDALDDAKKNSSPLNVATPLGSDEKPAEPKAS